MTTEDGRNVPAKRIISDADKEYVLYRTAEGDKEVEEKKAKDEGKAAALGCVFESLNLKLNIRDM
jgi:hypothetical protein